MRRHSLDPESIRKHIISVFSTSSRKRASLTNNNNVLLNLARRTRRFSVPEEEVSGNSTNPELHTIPEVSRLIECSYSHAYCTLCFACE